MSRSKRQKGRCAALKLKVSHQRWLFNAIDLNLFVALLLLDFECTHELLAHLDLP